MRLKPGTISLIVPSFNMSIHLRSLIASVAKSRLHLYLKEILIVDDASTDDTRGVLEALSTDYPRLPIIPLFLENNVGRFRARQIGAKAARGEGLIFIDARAELDESNDDSYELLATMPVVQGTIRIPIEESLFNLYWDRSHRFLFSKNFEDEVLGFHITAENYDQYVTGTTLLYCRREIFIEVCESFTVIPLNDDRELLRRIADKTPIFVTSKFRALWRPRQDLRKFLERLWERGPSFVEYNLFERNSHYRWIVGGGVILLIADILIIFFGQVTGLWFVGLQLLLAMLSLFAFTRNLWEFRKLLPLHLLVLATFGTAIIYSLFQAFFKRIKGNYA